LKGDWDAVAIPKSGCVAQDTAIIPVPARKLRLETPSMFLLLLITTLVEWHTSSC
jgi:hypothetical protein